MYVSAYCSAIDNSKVMEPTYVLSNKEMHKNVAYILCITHTLEFFSHK